MFMRFAADGALGWTVEILWTAIGSTLSGRQNGWRLAGTTYLWMFPIYGLIAPLFEPAHNSLRGHSRWLRAVIYSAGFLAVEYLCGWLLRKATGACPWDYSGRTRWHLHGLIRWDYAPAWAAFGLALEPVHDYLIELTSPVRSLHEPRFTRNRGSGQQAT